MLSALGRELMQLVAICYGFRAVRESLPHVVVSHLIFHIRYTDSDEAPATLIRFAVFFFWNSDASLPHVTRVRDLQFPRYLFSCGSIHEKKMVFVTNSSDHAHNQKSRPTYASPSTPNPSEAPHPWAFFFKFNFW